MLYSGQIIFRAGDTAVGQYWRNTWEFDAGALAVWSADVAADIATAVATFHRPLLLADYYIDRVVVGAYAEAGIMSPDQFVVVLDGSAGTRTRSTNHLLGLSSSLVVRRQTTQGRAGQLWLRGFLHEADVEGRATGALMLTAPTAVQADVADAFATFAANLAALGVDPVLARGTEPAALIRPVTGLVVNGAANRAVRRRVRRGPGLPAPLQTVVDTLGALGEAAGMINPILEAYNLLPLADVPLLPE